MSATVDGNACSCCGKPCTPEWHPYAHTPLAVRTPHECAGMSCVMNLLRDLTALRDDAQALCDALPDCMYIGCGRPATHDDIAGTPTSCDEHARSAHETEHAYAAPLRALVARLAGKVST